jgi:recombinational DNA repair protein (RecF pathway)
MSQMRETPDEEALCLKSLARMLVELGFKPETDSCVSCGAQARPGGFSISQGGVVCAKCKPQIGPTIRFDAGLQRTLAALTGDDPAMADRLRLSATQGLDLLFDLAQHHLEIRLNSRAFLSELWAEASRRD